MSRAAVLRMGKAGPFGLALRLLVLVLVLMAAVLAGRYLLGVRSGGNGTAAGHLQLGRELLAKGDFTGAIEEIKAAAKLEPKSMNVQAELGRAYEAAGNTASSIKSYEQALRNEPSSYDNLKSIAILKMKEGDYAGARVLLEKYLKMSKNIVAGHAALGDFFIARKDYAAAAREYERALTGASEVNIRVTLLNLLAFSYASLGDKAKATATYAKVLRLDPGNAVARDNLRVIGK